MKISKETPLSFTSHTFYTKSNSKPMNIQVNLKNHIQPTRDNKKLRLFNEIEYTKPSIEELNERNRVLKKEINEKNLVINMLKVDLVKIDEDNKKIMFMLEDIIHKSVFNKDEIKKYIDNLYNSSNDGFSSDITLSLSNDSILKLVETYIIMNMKNYIYKLRKRIVLLEEENEYLKKTERISNSLLLKKEINQYKREITGLNQTISRVLYENNILKESFYMNKSSKKQRLIYESQSAELERLLKLNSDLISVNKDLKNQINIRNNERINDKDNIQTQDKKETLENIFNNKINTSNSKENTSYKINDRVNIKHDEKEVNNKIKNTIIVNSNYLNIKDKFSIIKEELIETEKKNEENSKQTKEVSEFNCKFISNPTIGDYSNKKARYSINVLMSDDQNIKNNESFYVPDKTSELQSMRNEKKTKSMIIELKKVPTIDYALTENIKKGNDFEDLVNDPNIQKILNKINIS